LKKYTGKTSTAIIPYPDNKILLIKRNTRPFVGYWALPGGRMDPGETIEQTVVREVKEETGLQSEIVRVVGEYVERGIKDDIEYEYYPTCFVVKAVGGELKKQDSEIQEMELFSIDDLPLPLAFEHEKMIKDYVHTQKRRERNLGV
jgi:8-oxo-dGTP diphosphatase